jgi:replicative DNA helicase
MTDKDSLQASIIGAALTDPAKAAFLVENTIPEMYSGVHKDIFLTIKAMYQSRSPITFATVMAVGSVPQGDLIRVMLSAAPGDAFDANLASLKQEMYMHMVEDSVRLVREAHEKGESMEQAFFMAVSKISESNLSGVEKSATLSAKLHSGASRTKKNIEDGIMILGTPSPWRTFNAMTEGWPSGLSIIGARPSMGKTTIATALLMDQALRGKHSGFVSLEMRTIRIADKIAGDFLGVNDVNLAKGIMRVDELNRYETMPGLEWTKLVHMEEFPGTMLEDVVVAIYKLRAKGCELIIVDHIHKIRTKKTFDKEQMYATISSTLSSLGLILDCKIICLAQLSRAVEIKGGDKRPAMEHIKYASAIEEDSEIVSMLYRPSLYGITEADDGSVYPDGYIELIVRKCRTTGKTGIIPLIKGSAGVQEARMDMNISHDNEIELPF